MTDQRSKRLRDADRARGLLPVGEQVLEYVGSIYQSGYDRAANAAPIWRCQHRHYHWQEAERCARAEIERRGDKAR